MLSALEIWQTLLLMTVRIILEIKTQKKVQNVIVNELHSTTFKGEFYPDTEQLSEINKNKGWLTGNLRLFMETLIKNPLRQCSIGQAVVSAVKPRSALSPILSAVGSSGSLSNLVNLDLVLARTKYLDINSQL